MQEVTMKENELTGFERTAKKYGYKPYVTKGIMEYKTVQNMEAQEEDKRYRGTVVTLVRKDLPQKRLEEAAIQTAQAQCVWVSGWAIINSYNPPGEQDSHIQVLEKIMREGKMNWKKDKWVWVADHNAEQHNSEIGTTMEGYDGIRLKMDGDSEQDEGKNQTTKWNNDKAIDHIYTNRTKRTKNNRINSEEKISDHKALEVTLLVEQEFERGINVMAKTATYTKLDTMETEEWQECLKQTWNEQDHSRREEMMKRKPIRKRNEEEWKEFNMELEKMCIKSQEKTKNMYESCRH